MSLPARRPLICLITEGILTNYNFDLQQVPILSAIRAAVDAGIPLVQIREKALSAKLLFELTRAAVALCKGSHTQILVNGRADVAATANAAGVQLPENGVPVTALRQTMPKGFLIGRSCHDLSGAFIAREEGADFITLSPIFHSPAKGTPIGIPALSECVNRLDDFPVIALGGINHENFETVLRAGAAGFAAIRFLNDETELVKLGKKYFGEKQ